MPGVISRERPDSADASALIAELEAELFPLYPQASRHGVVLLRLETGIHQHAAIGLYERMGLSLVPPFGEYREDPLSRFYEKKLAEA
jgi:putative acetyltransferase